MDLPSRKRDDSEGMTTEQLRERVKKLQRELLERGQSDDEVVAHMMNLQDQLQQAELEKVAEKAAREEREREFKKQYQEAMAKVDAARNEQRLQRAQNDKEKEEEIRIQEARKVTRAMRDKDDKISLLKQKLDAKQQELGAKQQEIDRAEAEKAEKGKNEQRAREGQDRKDREVQNLLRVARGREDLIKNLEQQLADARYRLDLAEAGVPQNDQHKTAVARLEEENARLTKSLAEMNDVLEEYKVHNYELMQAHNRHQDMANDYDATTALCRRLEEKVRVFEQEDGKLIDKQSSLKTVNANLSLRIVRQARDIEFRDKQIEKGKGMLKAMKDRIVQLEHTVNISGADDLWEEKGKLAEEKEMLEAEKQSLKNEFRRWNQRLETLERETDEKGGAELKESLEASQDTVVQLERKVTRLDRQLTDNQNARDREREKHGDEMRRQKQELKEVLRQIRRLRHIEQVPMDPRRAELSDLRYKVEEHEIDREEYEQEIRRLNKHVESDEILIASLTKEQERLLDTVEDLETRLTNSIKSVGKLQKASEKARAGAARRGGWGQAGANFNEEQLAAKFEELERINEGLREGILDTSEDAETRLKQFRRSKALASLQILEIYLSFMVIKRALDGMVANDMDFVMEALDHALSDIKAHDLDDNYFAAQITFYAAVADYYNGDTAGALKGFMEAQWLTANWPQNTKDMMNEWVIQCTPSVGLECPRRRDGYLEGLGFEPIASGHGISKEEKKAKKVARKAAKKSKKAKRKRKPPAPRRGVHRRELFVDVLTPEQERIWNTIDFGRFDYEGLTPAQQSLFSFVAFEDEPESPGKADSPSGRHGVQPYDYSPLPRSTSAEGAPPSSSSSDDPAGAEGDLPQGQRPSRLHETTTDAALHIQWLTARLADREERIRSFERAPGKVSPEQVQKLISLIEDVRTFVEAFLDDQFVTDTAFLVDHKGKLLKIPIEILERTIMYIEYVQAFVKRYSPDELTADVARVRELGEVTD